MKYIHVCNGISLQGRVFPAVLWDFYNNGCSIRMLNPQTFHNAVWRLCSTLQDHFNTMVSCGFVEDCLLDL